MLLVLGSGCGDSNEADNLPKDRVWESVHFRYHTRSTDNASCESVLVQLELHFQLIQTYLGFAWPTGRKVDYYKFVDRSDYLSNSKCPTDAEGCTSDSNVFSPYVLLSHELVHAYLAPTGIPPAFFTEGVASLSSCDTPVTIENPKSWVDLVTLPFSNRSDVYYEGTWFVGELIHRYGPARFLSFYSKLDYRSASLSEITASFEGVYGDSLDDVWSAALAGNTRTRCINLWQCNGAPLSVDGTLQTLASACDGSDTTRTFEFAADTDAVLSSSGYYIRAPLSCNDEFAIPIGGDSLDNIYFPAVLPIAASKYFVGAQGLGAADVGIRALPARAYSRDCSAPQPINLSSPEFEPSDVELVFPTDGNDWFVKLHPTSDRPLWAGVPGVLQECPSCQDLSTCISFDAVSHPDADGNVTLRFSSTSPGVGYVTYYALH